MPFSVEGQAGYDSQAAGDVPTFKNSAGQNKGSLMAANQNAFFEEYKQNLRKLNAKKASSPIMKSTI